MRRAAAVAMVGSELLIRAKGRHCRHHERVVTLGDQRQQCLDAIAPDAGNNAELGQVGADQF
jgi:hypothetical protein